ncbi:YceD family protein [Porticoccus sp.]
MSTPPQISQLPRILDPRRLANQGVVLSGQVAIAHCERLLDAVLEVSEPIAVELTFDIADQGRKVVCGEVATTVRVACQRCLAPLTVPVTASIQLGIVWSEDEAKSLSKDLDPWIVDGETADISAMVEDELLLALPFVTYHPSGQCHGDIPFSTGDNTGEEGKKNPFSILEQLKNSGADH